MQQQLTGLGGRAVAAAGGPPSFQPTIIVHGSVGSVSVAQHINGDVVTNVWQTQDGSTIKSGTANARDTITFTGRGYGDISSRSTKPKTVFDSMMNSNGMNSNGKRRATPAGGLKASSRKVECSQCGSAFANRGAFTKHQGSTTCRRRAEQLAADLAPSETPSTAPSKRCGASTRRTYSFSEKQKILSILLDRQNIYRDFTTAQLTTMGVAVLADTAAEYRVSFCIPS